MASDMGVDELAAYRHDPPPHYDSDDRQFHEWMSRHHNYFLSVDYLQFYRLPRMSPLWGYDESYFQNEMFRKHIHVTRVAGRRLTPDETALYLRHASKVTVLQSYDRPVAIVTTLFLISKGWRAYSSPFHQPTSAHFQPTIFPSPSWPLLRGYLASASWQGVRCVLYGAAGLVAYKLLSPVYRSLVDSSLEYLGKEPRLAHLNRDVIKVLDKAAADLD